MANPFLSDADFTEYGNGEADVAVSHMNPFLSGSDYNISDSAPENPFLSDAVTANDSFLASGTNPFASDFAEETSEVDFFAVEKEREDSVPTSTANSAFQDIFSSVVPEDPPAAAEPPPVEAVAAPPARPPHPPPPRPPPLSVPPPSADIFGDVVQQPPKMEPMVDLLGEDEDDEATSAETSRIMCPEEEVQHTEGMTQAAHHPPGRPPPPRPAPPSRETQELILSVTGAMEATSSHLLDRLRATKTPSPTPIRELHSPSPSPDPALFMTEEPAAEDLLGEDEDSKRPSTPPNVFPKPEAAPANEDFLDIFGGDKPVEEPPKEPATSNTDLLGLFGGEPVESAADGVFSAPVASTAVAPSSADLLMGDFGETAPQIEEEAPHSTVEEVNLLTGDLGEEQMVSKEVAPPVAESGGLCSVAESDFDAFAAKFESAAKEEEDVRGAVESGGDPFDPFAAGGGGEGGGGGGGDAWGSAGIADGTGGTGFGGDEEQFDAFLSMGEPLAPTPTPIPSAAPSKIIRRESADSDDGGPDFSIFIKPKVSEAEGPFDTAALSGAMPTLAPPPKSPVNAAYSEPSGASRFNPFDKSGLAADASSSPPVDSAEIESSHPQAIGLPGPGGEPGLPRSDSQETPPTPLFDEDVSQPLEDFPRIVHNEDEGWEMQLRQPNKKKITGQRFWKKVYVKLVSQGDNPVLQLYNTKDDKDPFQELPLQPCYSVSDISAQQYDVYGKIFTIKLQFIFYKERPGVRPGQVTKAERITNKLSQFAAYAIQGDYQGVKEFGSDLKKLGLPVEHAPQISQLLKLGSQSYEDLKKFSVVIEEALFRLSAHRDRALTYKTDEVQITAVDELYVEQNNQGHVTRQIARVRVFFLGFITGMPDIELGVNDMVRQGKEVVGRHDIIPVVTEEWIRLENVEFHSCVDTSEYDTTRVIKFKPPDACYIELMRFRVRPPKNRELPLQLKVTTCTTGNKAAYIQNAYFTPVIDKNMVDAILCLAIEGNPCLLVETLMREHCPHNLEFYPFIEAQKFCVIIIGYIAQKLLLIGEKLQIEIRGDILVPGFASRKLGQVPCEDISVRFPIPECWIYLFRVEKHFRYGSVKSAHRRTGKIKGIERLLGTMETLENSLIEVTSGQAKYEHQHRAIVWRMSRLPKEGQGAYTTHQFVCRLNLTSYDQMPETLDQFVYVEFTMPATQVSHTTIRSVSVSGGDNDPPEKYVRYLARHEYRVEVEHTQGSGPGAYVSATITTTKPPEAVVEEEKVDDASGKDSDSDSSS